MSVSRRAAWVTVSSNFVFDSGFLQKNRIKEGEKFRAVDGNQTFNPMLKLW